jgi:hypothetical protein
MTWVLVAVFAFAAWLSAVWFFVVLCSAASRGDDLSPARAQDRLTFVRATPDGEDNVIELRSYLSSRDSRRSLSSLPSV